ncbi:HIRAN domain-containing protein [Gudongella sp. DL1XJH-153]|uniref:HIRAN domain-containing protein n=1 Tax=Gudongella sp. DL1XJH-153 TaxID=3409804 RepID=UPI003BB5DC04
MSRKESSRRSMASSVLRRSHQLWKMGIKVCVSWSTLLKLCWRLLKKELETSVSIIRGVTFSNDDGSSRQMLIERLSRLPKGLYWLNLRRESDNTYDANAIRVDADRVDNMSAQLGYLPRDLAQVLAPEIDSGKEVVVVDFSFSQGWNGIFGVKLYYACI